MFAPLCSSLVGSNSHIKQKRKRERLNSKKSECDSVHYAARPKKACLLPPKAQCHCLEKREGVQQNYYEAGSLLFRLSSRAHLFKESVQNNKRCKKVEQNKIGIIIKLMRFERHFLIHIAIKKSKGHFNKEHASKQLFPTFPLTESISVLSCFMVGVQLLWPHYVSEVFTSS